MSAINEEALVWAADHHSTLTTERIRACGITSSQQRRLVSQGVLVRLADGTYRCVGMAPSLPALCVAASAHPKGLVVAGPTAGILWGLRRMPRDGLVHVIAPPMSHPIGAPWLRAYRTALLDPADIVRRDDGIVITSPPRTAVDLARWLPDDDLRSVIDQIEHLRLAQAVTMRRVAMLLDTRGRPWARRFLDVLDRRASGGTRESHGESLVVNALRDRGVADLESQRWLTVPHWGRVRLDAAVERLRWGIEIDGHPEHFSEQGAARDRERDLACDAIGWRVSRIAQLSLDRSFRTSIDRLMAVYLRRVDDIGRDAA